MTTLRDRLIDLAGVMCDSGHGEAFDLECLALAAARMALEDADAACKGLVDAREQARALIRAADAIKAGNVDDMLRTLKHEQTVHLYNGAMDKCAAAIRALRDGLEP